MVGIQILFWIILFFSPKQLNALVIESSIHESSVTGFKGFLKKIFLSRISKAYCSGRSQVSILDKLNFRGENCNYKRCWIIQYHQTACLIMS